MRKSHSEATLVPPECFLYSRGMSASTPIENLDCLSSFSWRGLGALFPRSVLLCLANLLGGICGGSRLLAKFKLFGWAIVRAVSAVFGFVHRLLEDFRGTHNHLMWKL